MRPPLATLCALALTGCGPTALGGSLGAVMDLSYSKVELRQTADEVTVVFGREGGDVALQVTAALSNIDALANVPINLAEKLTATQQRGQLSRSVRNDTTTTFPAMERGTLRLNAAPAKDSTVSGTFSATFIQGTSEPFGRTVNGDFTATVLQVP